jgi:RNA polymerase sigma-70 factor, ECF subfamily
MFSLFGKEGFAKIYLQFRRPIFKYVTRMVNDIQIAEELTQEIFLKAFRFSSTYQPKYALSTWLWTIARNTVLDWRRKSSLDPCREQRQESEFDLKVEDLPALSSNAEAHMIEKTEKEGIIGLLNSLTELQRRVLLLRVIHHLSYREISKKLGLSLSAVKCLAYRARHTLIGQLGYEPAFIY